MRQPASFFIVFTLMLVSSVAQAKVSTSLERTRIALGESVQLTISTDQKQGASGVDTTPLETDFDVLGRSSSSQVSMMNGQVKSETRIMLDLRPKRDGVLTIPALKLGKEQSLPLKLTVSNQPVTSTSPLQAGQTPVLIEAVWEDNPSATTQAYVQGQLNLVVRIYHQNNLRDAGLDEPRPADTLVRQIGKNRQGRATKNGVEYQTLEVRYALFPQKSGLLTVPPIPMQLRVPDQRQSGNRNFPFGGFFNQGRLVTLRTQPLSIEVLPPPPGYTGSVWLPAEEVVLNRTGLPDGPISVGDAINMQVDLSALGLTAEQLPEVTIPDLGRAFNAYPDQPEFENKTDGRIIIGHRQQTIVLIPAKAGELTIPEIEVDWWDTESNQQRSTKLPAVTVAVAAAPTNADASPTILAKGPESVSAPERISATQPATSIEPAYWKWAALAALLGWLLTSAYFLIWFRRKPAIKKIAGSPEVDLSSQIKQIELAAKQNNARDTWQALKSYGQASWPNRPPVTPQEWGERLQSKEAETVLAELDSVLFRGEPALPWSGQFLLGEVLPLLRQSTRQAKKPGAEPSGAIPALYPG